MQEIVLRKDYLKDESIESIYFGGGTPSILEVDEVHQFLNLIDEHFYIRKDAEVSLEANPDDLTKDRLIGLRQIGVNRLSIGIQSFQEEELKVLGRVHSANQAVQCIEDARNAAFDSVTIDLMYGIQDSSLESWSSNLKILKSLHINHFSAYALTVEPKTVLAHKINKGAKHDVDDELIRNQYFALKKFASENDYLHYEISNFSKDRCFSLHNTNYWKQKKYLGVGPSAHSFDLKSRRWNVSVNTNYITKIKSGESFWEEENLSKIDRFNEKLMLGLRTMWGINLDDLFEIYNPKSKQQFLNKIEYYEQMDFIKKKKPVIFLTDEGILFSDQIMSDLFIDE